MIIAITDRIYILVDIHVRNRVFVNFVRGIFSCLIDITLTGSKMISMVKSNHVNPRKLYVPMMRHRLFVVTNSCVISINETKCSNLIKTV